jgi:hypothetical protein
MMMMIPTIKLLLIAKYYTLPFLQVFPIFNVFLAIFWQLLLSTFLSQVFTISSFLHFYVSLAFAIFYNLSIMLSSLMLQNTLQHTKCKRTTKKFKQQEKIQ